MSAIPGYLYRTPVRSACVVYQLGRSWVYCHRVTPVPGDEIPYLPWISAVLKGFDDRGLGVHCLSLLRLRGVAVTTTTDRDVAR
jgi:hypothetical protein